MRLSIKKTYIYYFLILIPFFLVYAASTMSAFNKGISSALKLGAFIYMISFVLANLKFNKNLFYSFLIFTPFLIYGIIISFSFRAGIDDGIRYLFPIVCYGNVILSD